MSISLYELAAAAQELTALLAEASSDEQAAEINAALDALYPDIRERVAARWMAARNLDAEEKALREEAADLLQRAQQRARAAERVRTGTIACLDAAGLSEVPTRFGTIKIQKAGVPSVTVEVAPDRLPEQYQRVRVEPDRKALAAAWKAGEELPAGVTVSFTRFLAIR